MPSPNEKIIATLREQLKAKGYHYRDVATRLSVSQGTVKRYLSGKAVTLDVLQKIAEMVDLDVLSLAALTQQRGAPEPELNRDQQDALGRNGLLRLVYGNLVRGWTLPKIAQEFEFSPQKMDTLVARLQDLGLIRKLSARSVQILAKPHCMNKGGGPFSDYMVDLAGQLLREFDLRDPNCDWVQNAVRLSPSSVGRMREMIERLMGELNDLDAGDLHLSPQQVQWYRLFVGAQPMSRNKLLRTG